MDAFSALTSVLTTAAFEADTAGHVRNSNPPFVQLLRCVEGDDWRAGIAPEDGALVSSFWNALFTEPTKTHQPIYFRLSGGEARFQLRAQTVLDDAGGATSAVGIVIADEGAAPKPRWDVDGNTGLPDRAAAIQKIEEFGDTQRPFAVAVVVMDPSDATDDVRRKEAARQLLSTVRPSDLVTSSPDGSFVVCAADVAAEQAALQLGQRMSTALRISNLSARIGLAISSSDVAAATLVREAEAGAYASADGGVGFAD
ncbi:MAG: hypothetical protein ACR2P0_07025 [Acidimicrobiales bacterium]